MKPALVAASVAAFSTTSVYAGGLDRSGQPIGILFETGNHAELSFGTTNPTVDGTDLATTQSTGNVAEDFNTLSGGVKLQLNDKWSIALLADQPYGADILYTGSSAASSLGGTATTVDSTAITALARYKFDDNWSVHGGIRYQEISADVTIGGLAFGPLNGYNAQFSNDGALGYVVGAAY